MSTKITMQIFNTKPVFISNKIIPIQPKSSNLGKINLGSMPMIKRLAGAKSCGSCGK